MVLAAVLDASVLYPLPLRDTLLRIAQVGMYDPYWSGQILEEVTRNLIDNGVATKSQAAAMLNAMQCAFDSANVDPEEIARLEPTMTNDPKDRHVLAAAASAKADVIVTLNLRHFPQTACRQLSIAPTHPDQFLLGLYQFDRDSVRAALSLQAAALTRPAMTVSDILDRLTPTVPHFVQALQRQSS